MIDAEKTGGTCTTRIRPMELPERRACPSRVGALSRHGEATRKCSSWRTPRTDYATPQNRRTSGWCGCWQAPRTRLTSDDSQTLSSLMSISMDLGFMIEEQWMSLWKFLCKCSPIGNQGIWVHPGFFGVQISFASCFDKLCRRDVVVVGVDCNGLGFEPNRT